MISRLWNRLLRKSTKAKKSRGKSGTNYLIGGLKQLALDTPKGKRAKAIREQLQDLGFHKVNLWTDK